MVYFNKHNVLLLIIFLYLSVSCQTEKTKIQDGFWVENDAETSLVNFSEDGRFINIRNPESKIAYKIDGDSIRFKSGSDSYSLEIKKANETELVFCSDKEEFTFYRATANDYLHGIWQGVGGSSNIEISFAEKNNGYLTIKSDSIDHSEYFTYQIIANKLIILKQDKSIDTTIFEFDDTLKNLILTNTNKSSIKLQRAYF